MITYRLLRHQGNLFAVLLYIEFRNKLIVELKNEEVRKKKHWRMAIRT